jgi:two-component system chemotaxis sensor kinase CheA
LLFLEEILHPERVGESSDRQSEYWQVAVVAADGNRFGIVVDNVIDTVDIVIKRLSHALADLQVYAGATILGDGEVALIIDPAGLVRQAGLLGGGGLKKEELEDLRLEDAEKLGSDGRREDLVLVENSDGGRITLPLEDVIRLDKITAMDQQVAGGQVMANYRGQVMPLIWVSEVLPERRVGERAIRVDRDDPQQRVVVVNHRDKPLGLVVHRLLDIGAEVITGERPGSRKGVASCGLIRDKVTEFLDVAEVFELANLDGSLTNLTSSQPVEDPAANSPEGDPA